MTDTFLWRRESEVFAPGFMFDALFGSGGCKRPGVGMIPRKLCQLRLGAAWSGNNLAHNGIRRLSKLVRFFW